VAGVAGFFWLAIFPATLFAQQQQPQFRNGRPPPILDDAPRGNGAGFTGTEGLTNVPPGAFQPNPPLVTPQSLFRSTQFPTVAVTPPPLGPEVHSENLHGEFKLGLPTLAGSLPFFGRGFEPQDADLKAGPFFLKVRSLEAAVLHSDNINLSPDHKESGTIAIAALTIDIIAQITESVRLATSGTFVYFPIEGKAGVTGFGLSDVYDFGLAAGPLAHAQLVWDTQIGGWHVVFADNFLIQEGIFSDDIRSNTVLFEGGRFDENSRAGRYVFLPPQGNSFRNQENNNRNDLTFRNTPLVFSNSISATADRLLPGTVRLQLQAYHEDLWYNQGNRGLPSLRDGASLLIASERENMRFKPYFRYDAVFTDEFSDVQSVFRLGVSGPITNQLWLRAEAGYYTGGLGNNGALWDVQLTHVAGPYTQESLSYVRQFNYFHDEIVEGVGYNVQQILGPKLTLNAFLYRLSIQELGVDSDNFTRDETLAALSLTYAMGPKTTFRATAEYATIDPDQTTAWTGRMELGYNFTDTLLLHLLYQYQKSSSSLNFNQNYTENLFFLSLTKYFR
jgi:hypothetical protein